MVEPSRSGFERQVAQKTQEQFQFYLLALAFTILAASIQTAKFGASIWADGLELSGWIALILSGLSGLLHIESSSVQRFILAEQVKYEDEVAKLRELQLQGKEKVFVMQTQSTQSISQQIENRIESHKVVSKLFEDMDRSGATKYQVHRRCFVLGLLLVAGARAHPGVCNLWRALGDA
jgi:hypothetical protein